MIQIAIYADVGARAGRHDHIVDGEQRDVLARVWYGRYGDGQACRVYVVAVEFGNPRQLVELERDLARLDR